MNDKWYYRIQLSNNEYTNGRPIGTLRVLKDIWSRVNFENARILDIGTQEFVAPIVLTHKGAKEVIAYDRLDLSDRKNILSEIYDLSKTTYLSGRHITGLRSQMEEEKIDPVFDIVNFTGVLYHTIDPLAFMGTARSFLREKGLMIFETSVTTAKGYIAQCNHKGTLYPGSNYFQLSVDTLDYWCRALRMEVLDAFWRGGKDIKRLFLVLQATDEVIAEPDDAWIRKGFWVKDFDQCGLNYKKLSVAESSKVGYTLKAKENIVWSEKNEKMMMVRETLDKIGDFDKEIKNERMKILNENPNIDKNEVFKMVDAKYQLTKLGSLDFSDVGMK